MKSMRMKKILMAALSLSVSVAGAMAEEVVGEPQSGFSFSPSGAATYTIAVECPPGVNGMQPSVSLSYNSQSGLGIAGWGWNVTGVSSITKTCPNLYYDKVSKPLNSDLSGDYLTLDGQRLVKVKEIDSTHVEFRTENDALNRIVRVGKDGAYSFMVYSTDGSNMRYSQLKTGVSYYKGNLGWYLTEVSDRYGNYMTYTYGTTVSGKNIQEVLLKKISYGANRTAGTSHSCVVTFAYDSVAPTSYYMDGLPKKMFHRLSSITSTSKSTTYRKYGLVYQTNALGRSQLKKVQVFGNNGDNYKDFDVFWENVGTQLSERSMTESFSVNKNDEKKFWMPLDYDNDGFTDMAYYCQRDGKGALSFYDNNNGNLELSRIRSVELGDLHTSTLSCQFTHVGDAQKLIFVLRDKDGGPNLNLYDVVSGSEVTLTTLSKSHKKALPLYAVGDFNRDGYDDIAILELYTNSAGKYPLTVFFGMDAPDFFNGAVTSFQKKTFNVPLSSSPQRLYATDLNVDGSLDVLILTEKGYWVYKNTSAKKGTLTLEAALSKKTAETFSDLKVSESFRCVEPGDFNGDGKLDFFVGSSDENYLMNGSSSFSFVKKTVAYSGNLRGSGLLEGEVPSIPFESEDFMIVFDFDQDGKSDFVTYQEKGKKVVWYRSLGNNEFNYMSQFFNRQSEEGTLNSGNVIVGDFNGDGRAELLSIGAASASLIRENSQANKFYLSGLSSPATGGLVTAVKSPSKQVNIVYSQLTNKNVYKRTGMMTCANVVSVMTPMWVVSKVTDDLQNGEVSRSMTFTYEDALFETTGKGFLGFAATTATSDGLTTRTESKLNASPTFLTTSKTSVYKGTEFVNSSTLTTKAVVSGKKFKLQTTKSVETDNLRGTTKTTTYANYNAYNIPATTTVDCGTGVKQITTLSDFLIDETHNTCLPMKKSVKKVNSGGNTTQTTTYEYDDHYALSKTVEYAGTALAVTATRTYDTFGNQISVKTEAADCEDRLTKYTYTASGRFLASVTESDGTKTSITNDEKYCRPTKKTVTTGSISHTTSYLTYDGFNNCLRTKYPDGRIDTVTATYGPGFSQNQCLFWVERKCAGEPTVRKFYKAGKIQFLATLAMDGKWRSQMINYDAYGRLKNRSQVYESSPYNILRDEYKYDEYGRLVEAKEIGGTTTYQYDKLKTTITSPTGIKVLEYNAAGQLIKSTENGKSVTFEYNPAGLLKKSTPQDGKAVSMTYNLAGHCTKMVDPDAGEVVWEYDSYGRELSIWQKKVSAKKRTYTTYDEQGRILSIEGPEWQAHYTYDASNRLVKEENPLNECKKTYTYDKFGRVTKCVESLPEKSLTTSYTYAKNYGGATKVTYPSGYAVTNVYDNYGNLTAVKNGETLLWQWKELDKTGALTKDAICGSVVRTRIYDEAGKVWSETAYKGNTGLMSLAYDYREDDEEGGALAPVLRKDLIGSCNDRITYSGNRITTLSVSNPRTGMQGDYIYDNLGNITGTYDHRWYRIAYGIEGATPHQLSMVSYEGRFAPHGERKIFFNSTLWKAKKITEAGLTYEFEYGTDRQRFKTVLSRGDKVLRTRYYTDDYDLTLDSLGKKREVHYIYGGNGLAAIYVKNAGKDSLFAAATDRQGSLMATMHTASGKVERYSYDPFGRRRNADNWLQSVSTEPRFSRGYCMHEHVPEMDMIDMNGRLYDPTLCQFLSPDPYIQDPTNWQNYNRYAYCLQNPMLYTDPTGEKVAWWQAIAATVLSPTPGTINGLVNVYCNNESGYIQSTSDMWKCFGQGFVAGSVMPASTSSFEFMTVL
ncbi:MAG: VCBS repeat-containing protein, partial [Paludibacteraceae bacterium]|nr:VCBS repeat-containing protein [Paludibacteraceae bacterium]